MSTGLRLPTWALLEMYKRKWQLDTGTSFDPAFLAQAPAALRLSNPSDDRAVGRLVSGASQSPLCVTAGQTLTLHRRRRLTGVSRAERRQRILVLLERSVWPKLPRGERGRRLTRAEEDEILGYGPGGA